MIWYHAPWFIGSSWHQTTSLAAGIFRELGRRLPRAGTDKAARRARSRRRRSCAWRHPRPDRSRPCPSTARRAAPSSGSVAVVSGITSWKPPSARSSSVDTASLWRSSDFGVMHDQRLAHVAQHLPAQHVEHLRRRRRHADLHVLQRAQLQIAFQARGAVLRALAFVAVRQEQAQARHAVPLGLARRDELVDDDLRAVGEIAELAFPDVQRVRLGGRVAVLECHHRFFAQQRVDDRDVRDVAHGRRAARSRRRSSDRGSPRGDGRTCRGRNPGRPGAGRSRHRSASHRRGSRRSPSPSAARRPPSSARSS